MSKRVVITGLGAVTAAGEGAETLWNASLNGRSGIDFIHFGANGMPLTGASEGTGHESNWRSIGALIPDFNPEKYVTQRKSLKVMARDIQLAVAASSLAIDDAVLRDHAADRERFGVIAGSGVLNHELDEMAYGVHNSLDTHGDLDLKKFGTEGLPSLFPLWLLKYLPNMSACHASILFDLQGPNNTITTGPSAGLQAVGEAYRIIQRGAADIMLAGGAESKLNPVGFSEYKILGVLSENTIDPKRSYKSFDISSDGLVVGEGSGFLVLEELEHAKKRGAKIYAEITGFGSSSSTGQKIAMRAALDDAKISPKEIDCIQASGLGLERDDVLEGEAIQALFDGSNPNLRVSASKAITGFTGYSAGTLDLIISALAVRDQMIPPILNLKKPRRDWKFKFADQSLQKTRLRNILTNTFGFGGQSASMIIKEYVGN